MKKYIYISALIFMMIIAALSGCGNADAGNILSINDILSDPFSFTGEVTLNGVAVGFAQNDPTLFGITDTAELLVCKNLNCGAFVLTVLYEGGKSLPELCDEVNVTGTFKIEYEEDRLVAFYFEATKFNVKRNVMKLISS